jgi:hypothetical protein
VTAQTSLVCNFVQADWVDNYVQKTLKMDLSPYKHRIYILSSRSRCPWVGLGNVGCFGQFCRVIMQGSFAKQAGGFFHEIGHNLGTHHAKKGAFEYGDWSCAMGLCCAARCYNAPRAWHLKWSSTVPNGALDGTTWAKGGQIDFLLPTQVWPVIQ